MATIRRAVERDLPAITDLYNHYVETSPITFDIGLLSVEARRPWFEAFSDTGRHQLFVAERDGALLGYAGAHGFRPKAAYDTSVETTIYLAPEATGAGLGSRLYQALFAALEGEDVHRAYAGITLPNEPSIALHRRFGFERIGIYGEVGRKLGRYWDVEWLEKAL